MAKKRRRRREEEEEVIQEKRKILLWRETCWFLLDVLWWCVLSVSVSHMTYTER